MTARHRATHEYVRKYPDQVAYWRERNGWVLRGILIGLAIWGIPIGLLWLISVGGG